jgi:hypothetical protein
VDVDRRIDEEVGLGSDNTSIKYGIRRAERPAVEFIQELGRERGEK